MTQELALGGTGREGPTLAVSCAGLVPGLQAVCHWGSGSAREGQRGSPASGVPLGHPGIPSVGGVPGSCSLAVHTVR